MLRPPIGPADSIVDLPGPFLPAVRIVESSAEGIITMHPL